MRTVLFRIALVALLVILSGCVLPAYDGTGESSNDSSVPDDQAETDLDRSPSAKYDDVERAAALPVRINATFDRTTALLGSDGKRPDVAVENVTPALERYYDRWTRKPFLRLLNLTHVAIDTTNTRGITYGPGRVTVDPNEGSARMIERTLVHEYVHALQSQRRIDLSAETTDEELVRTALVEGGAVWVADQYVSEYHRPETRTYQSARIRAEYRAGPAGDRYIRAPYRFGAKYVSRVLDDPTSFWTLYDRSPSTSSVLLHADPAVEQPSDLSTTVTSDDRWQPVGIGPDGQPGDRMGELFLRTVLMSELSTERASRGAAGWTDDDRRTFRHGGSYGHLWTLSWANRTEATEFVTTFQRYLVDRTDQRTSDIELRRVGDRTVTVVAGPDTFRSAVHVTGSSTDVSIMIAADQSTTSDRSPLGVPS
jgi:hypothetical protein